MAAISPVPHTEGERNISSPPRPISSPSSTAICYTGPCLLPLLQPIRQCLQPFLTAKDAMRLIRTSQSIATSLLAGYAIFDHDHALSYGHRTPADTKRSIALFAQYGMQLCAMCLPSEWNEPLFDAAIGQSVLPSSLVALMIGGSSRADDVLDTKSILRACFDGTDTHGHWMAERVQSAQTSAVENESEVAELYRLMQAVITGPKDSAWGHWGVFEYANIQAAFNQPIPPGALPRGLRFLQFGNLFNQPLLVGSIPDTVEVLQFGGNFNQRLALSHLPVSLTHLSFGDKYIQLLLPGVLPAGLKRLHLGHKYSHPLLPGALPPQLQQLSLSYYLSHPILLGDIPSSVTHLFLGGWYNHPLLPGVLPPQLRRLSLGYDFNNFIPPGVIPPSVTHLRLSPYFNQPLHIGSIPEGVCHLSLGRDFNKPLPPGVLPSSLRQLLMSSAFYQPLQPGTLPDGLEVLAFPPQGAYQHTLQPGVIPASVRVVSLPRRYKQALIDGSIPSGVQLVLLPADYANKDWTCVLSPATRVQWHKS